LTRGLPEDADATTSIHVTGQCSSEIHYLATCLEKVVPAGTFWSQMTADVGSFSGRRCKARFCSGGLNRDEKTPPTAATTACSC